MVSRNEKFNVKGLVVTSEMEDKWAEHRGIEQRGRNKRGKRRSANLDLTKQLTRGHQEEIKKVLGDDLYAQMTRSASIEPIKPSEGVITPNMSRISPHSNPRTRTENLDNLYKQRSELQDKHSFKKDIK